MKNENFEKGLLEGGITQSDGIISDSSPSLNVGQGFIADTFNSGFSISHDTYNGIYGASDGMIYYVLCSQSIDEGGRMYAFNPATEAVEFCGDLTEVCGEMGQKTIPQGKSHVSFIESNGKLFFGTHVGFYSNVEGMEKMGIPPEGYKPYPGGHLLVFDLKTRKFDDLGIVPHNEGVLTMNMDTRRGIIYGITWPTGYFFRYDLNKREMKNLGPVSGEGEKGVGENYRTLCRSIAINPDEGDVYLSKSEGDILCCREGQDAAETITGDNLKKDYFGYYEPASPGHMGYHWRQVFWYPGNRSVYGVHGNSGYLFRFDPRRDHVEVLDRITSRASQRSGMYDQFSYGYLGLILGPDKRTIYYLTGCPIYINGKRVLGKPNTAKGEAKGLENLHLITYDIPAGIYQDHGPVYFRNGQRPLYVNSIAIGLDGALYFLGRITENNQTRTDLIRILNPLQGRASL